MTQIKTIGTFKVILLYAITSSLIYSGLYFVIPVLLKSGLLFFPSYLITFYPAFILMFILTFILLKRDGYSLRYNVLSERLRLKKLTKKDLWITLLLFIICIGIYFLLSFSGSVLANIPVFAPPDFFPPEINPLKHKLVNGTFMNYPLLGNWWIPLIYFICWIFNILGEELLWRGYLIPRMELKWKNNAWIVNGLLWWVWHFYWKWNLLILLPTNLLIPFVVQKRKNTWIGIIVHGTMNFLPVIYLILGVTGVVK